MTPRTLVRVPMGRHQNPLNLLLIICICFTFHPNDAVSGNDLDKSALFKFKRSVSDPSGMLVSWNDSNSDLCSWVGVSCGSNYRVVSLNITGGVNSGSFACTKYDQFLSYGFGIRKNCVSRKTKLTGKLSESISKLSELKVLSLPFNDLEGEIPVQIWGLKKLEVIDLEGNMITGNLNYNFKDLKSLRVLNLGFNQITGEIPDSLSNLKNLQILLLNNKKLSGQIPSGFTNTTRMMRFNVSFNQLSDPLPENVETGGNYVNYSDSKPTRKRRNWSFNSIEIGTKTSASVILSALMVLIVLFFCTRSRPKSMAHGSTQKEVVIFIDIGVSLNFDSVIQATGDFNASNCISNGEAGATYKAEISPGFQLAIKRLAVGQFEGIQRFENEIKTLGQLCHPNLVKLIGYHASETDMFLIFNYLAGGNLEKFIQERSMRAVDWHILHKIALDVARALAYLHDQCIPRIIHRDVKPSNILLDDDFNAYLSDFRLAQIVHTSETHTTTEVVGTFGYMAPEYAITCQVSDKADVYSYGVVLLELLSDKRALDPSFSSYGNGFNIVEWARMLLREGHAEEFFTVGLWDAGPHDDLVEVLNLAVVCTTDAMSTRPTMKQVVLTLKQLQPPSC